MNSMIPEEQRAALHEAGAALGDAVSALGVAFSALGEAAGKFVNFFTKFIPVAVSLYEKYGVYSEIKEGRVRHLSLYSKKKRVRKKNFNRLKKMMKGGKNDENCFES